ncbi:STT3 domain-containing protein [Candidatus Aenigmatarchaeota archaeon]
MKKVKRNINLKVWIRNNWHLIALLVIFISAFWLRSLPARYGELQALDPFHLYRMSEGLVNNNFQLPENDLLRYYPLGVNSLYYDYMVPMYLPAITYTLLSTIGLNMHYLHFAILWPAALGALAVLVMYFIGKELFNRKAGLFAAFFLATTPAFITRTSAGFFEKEGIAGLFTLLSIFMFIKAYKSSSWKYGILSGLSLAVVSGAWGGVRYFYLLFSGFLGLLILLSAIVLILDHLFDGFESMSDKLEGFFGMAMLKAYLPTILIGTLLFQLLPVHQSLTGAETMISYAVLAALLIRNVIVKFDMISKDKIKAIIPSILVLGLVVVLVGSMFSDVLYSNLAHISRLIGVIRVDVVGTTVAENAPGNWGNIVGMTGTGWSGGIIPQLNFIAPYAALWILMILGLFLLLYRFFRTREWIVFFSIVWLLSAIWGVFYAVRLVFLVGPPAALIGGFFMSWFVERLHRFHAKRHSKKDSPRRFGIIHIVILVVAALIIVVNAASAYQYSNNLGPSICIMNTGKPCVTIAEDGSVVLNDQQPWYQAMNFLSETGQDNSVLSWWDFGYWFQTRGNKPSVADGGNIGGPYGDRDHNIAYWFTSNNDQWYEWEDWMQNLSADYILMDYTLPGKYGAISKISSKGEQIVGFLEFQNTGMYPKEGKDTFIFANGPYEIWIPFDSEGKLAGTPQFLVKEGNQYQQRLYINDVCSKDYGIITAGDETPSIGGCVALSDIGVFYIPAEAEHSIFVNLMFMEGYGLPVEKVFDNTWIKIFKVDYDGGVTEPVPPAPEVTESLPVESGYV